MDAKQFPAHLRAMAMQLNTYMREEFPRMVVRKTKRFIEGNFRAKGWQGTTFQPWKTKLIKTGRMRRGTVGETGPYTAKIWNAVPYARFHNRGANGTANVRAFTRNNYSAIRVPTGRFTKSGTERTKIMHQVSGSSQVGAHTRSVNIRQQQFMPESIDDSPVLRDSIRRELVTNIRNISNQ